MRRYNRLNCNRSIRESNNYNNIQDIPGPSVAHPSGYISHNDFINDISIVDDGTLSSSSSSSSSNISNVNGKVSSFFEDTSIQLSFRERLASCFVDNNLTHVQCNNILSLLRTHLCFSNLPKDVRTLIDTPCRHVVVSNVEPGEYVYFDLARTLVQTLSNISFASKINKLELDVNTDGCSLDKSGSVHVWPIQCRITNVYGTKPTVVSIYKGIQKPNDPNTFFKKIVIDIRRIMSSGGIDFHGKKIPIRLRCFIANAPARAFILNHHSHISSYPCSKCKVDGVRSEGRYVFLNVNNHLRTDEEYIRCVDEDHHKEGTCPLAMLPLGMVSL